MMGPRQVDRAVLFYEFSLERHFPATHLLWSVGNRRMLSAFGEKSKSVRCSKS
jgi:hypothetical protein